MPSENPPPAVAPSEPSVIPSEPSVILSEPSVILSEAKDLLLPDEAKNLLSPDEAKDLLHSLVEAYQRSGDVGKLLDELRALARRTPPDQLTAVANEYKEMPEVVIPLYERIVAALPNDAQALVVLANSYWVTGRGHDVVGSMASRAKQLDPDNRGAWHLWALAEADLRKRVERWQAVTKQFPGDQLARAALADNATSLATDEDDPVALKLAIETYESLLAEGPPTAQRLALEETLKALRRGN